MIDHLTVVAKLNGLATIGKPLNDIVSGWFCSLCEIRGIAGTSPAVSIDIKDGNDNSFLEVIVVQTDDGLCIVEMDVNEQDLIEIIAHHEFLQDIPIIIINDCA